MADSRIKIISNPYSKSVSFMRWDREWRPINYSTDPTSGLVSEDIVHGFFPFVAKRVVELIVKEYGKGASIVFEGPEDEFKDLQSICSEEGIPLSWGERDLANASDALPSIKRVFERAESSIGGTDIDRTDIDPDIVKFRNVAKDQVPICVIGNYSAGKSTFINALIGYEYLPSGTEALTAKVFRINEGDDARHATIAFGSDDSRQELWIDETGIVKSKSSGDEAFIEIVAARLGDSSAKGDLAAQVNQALRLLNSADAFKEGQVTVPDLINLEVPFNVTDSWMDASDFVIFDTPGSNSSTNEDHARVLREAMEGLSDGLLVFLGTPTSLDTIDNANLCRAAKAIDAMDDRFTMVIVNSADHIECPLEGFSRDRERDVLSQTIPRELSPQGIYYVSSPVALGAKTGGCFTNQSTRWAFNGIRERFSNPSNEQYTELYRCNILPAHIKQRISAECEECGNLPLANSGIYAVEGEIALFAQKYSAYNKCKQAEKLLRRILAVATKDLQSEKETLEQELKDAEESLERDKTALADELVSRKEEASVRVAKAYRQVLDGLSCSQWLIYIEKLKSKESEFTDDRSLEHGLEDAVSTTKDAQKAARENFFARLGDVAKTRSVDSLRDAIQGITEDAELVRDFESELAERQRVVDHEAADLLLDYVRNSFAKAFEIMTSDVETRSQQYLTRAAGEVRRALYDTAMGSTALSEEKRNELGAVIIGFRDLELTTDVEALFNKPELDETFRFFNFVVIESERLNLHKVRDTYNKKLKQAFGAAVEAVDQSHSQSFADWLEELMSDIKANITSYNPALREYVKDIDLHMITVKEHEEVLSELDDCLKTIAQLIDWRERE